MVWCAVVCVRVCVCFICMSILSYKYHGLYRLRHVASSGYSGRTLNSLRRTMVWCVVVCVCVCVEYVHVITLEGLVCARSTCIVRVHDCTLLE